MTNAAVYSEGAQLLVGEQCASSPRRVSFAPEAQYASNQPRSSVNNSWQHSNAGTQYSRSRRFGPRRNFMPRQAQLGQLGNSGDSSNAWPEQQQFYSCGKCGWRRASRIGYIYATQMLFLTLPIYYDVLPCWIDWTKQSNGSSFKLHKPRTNF